MFKRTVAFIMVVVMLFTMAPDAYTASDDVHNDSIDKIITIPQDEEAHLKAKSDAKGLKWQVEIDNSWIDIFGADDQTFDFGYGFAKGAMNEEKLCHVRCVDENGHKDSEYLVGFDQHENQEMAKTARTFSMDEPVYSAVSETKVTCKANMDNQIQGENEAAPKGKATMLTAQEKAKDYIVTVEYKNENNAVIHPEWKKVITGGTIDYTIYFPEIKGYQAYVNCEYKEGVWIGGTEQNSYVINSSDLKEDMKMTVIYKPGPANYIVHKYYQNINDQNYSVKTETKQGITGEKVNIQELVAEDKGFAAMWDDEPVILADGTTQVNIYYDRLYYLMNFDLGEGGKGVEPIYAKYETPVNIGTPTRKGYVFDHWEVNGQRISEINKVPAEDTVYKAVWIQNETAPLKIKIYLSDPEKDNPSVIGDYEYYDETTIDAVVGTTVSEGDLFKLNCKEHEKTHEGEHTPYCYRATETPTKETTLFGTLIADELNKMYPQIDGQIGQRGGWGNDGKALYNYVYHVDTNTAKTGWYRFSLTGYLNNDARERKCYVHDISCYDIPTGLNTAGKPFDYSTVIANNKLNTSVNVEAKGSEISLYYDRKIYTYHFRPTNIDTLPGLNLMVDLDNITAPWGRDIEKAFNEINSKNGATSSGWSESINRGGEATAIKTKMEPRNRYFYKRYNIGLDKTAQYYVAKLGNKDLTKAASYDLKYTLTTTVANAVVSESDFIDIPGFIIYKSDTGEAKTAKKGDKYEGSKFYYERKKSDVKFHIAKDSIKNVSYEYEASLKDAALTKNDMDTTYYPNEIFKPGEKEFVGWYLDKECTIEMDWSKQLMPATDIEVYAKWKNRIYDVKTFEDENGNAIGEYKCEYGQKITNLSHPNRLDQNQIFMGWFYKENGQEQAFDNLKMPVTKNLTLYAKWATRVMVNYTVHYAIKGANDGIEEIGEPLTGTILGNTTRTFYAKSGIELYDKYKVHYYPTEASQVYTMNIDPDTMNHIWFYYEYRKESLKYTVNYIDKETGAKLHESKTVETTEPLVYENFIEISEYVPDAHSKKLILSTNDKENVITFYYSKGEKKAPLRYTSWIEDVNGKYVIYEDDASRLGTVGEEYTIENISIPGYQEVTREDTLTSGQLTEKGLHLQRFYERISYPYEIRFLDENTHKPVADPIKNTAKMGHEITCNAKTVETYKCVNPHDYKMKILIEDPKTDAKNNVYVYYYKKIDQFFDLTIHKTGWDSNDENQTFVLKVKRLDSVVENMDVTAVVKGNGKVVIKGLPEGSYEISEDKSWSWRYQPIEPQIINLQKNEEVTVNSSRIKTLWLSSMDFIKNLWK